MPEQITITAQVFTPERTTVRKPVAVNVTGRSEAQIGAMINVVNRPDYAFSVLHSDDYSVKPIERSEYDVTWVYYREDGALIALRINYRGKIVSETVSKL